MIWNEDNLVELACRALASVAREFDLENATRGIDCLNEVELQADLRDSNFAKRRNGEGSALSRGAYYRTLNHGKRCDLLLFRDSEDLQLVPQLDADKVGYWVEIKRVAQFLESGPNWYYERTLLETLPQDVLKLANDLKIFYAGLLVILFTSNGSIGKRDLHTWKCHAMSHGCPLESLESAILASAIESAMNTLSLPFFSFVDSS